MVLYRVRPSYLHGTIPKCRAGKLHALQDQAEQGSVTLLDILQYFLLRGLFSYSTQRAAVSYPDRAFCVLDGRRPRARRSDNKELVEWAYYDHDRSHRRYCLRADATAQAIKFDQLTIIDRMKDSFYDSDFEFTTDDG